MVLQSMTSLQVSPHVTDQVSWTKPSLGGFLCNPSSPWLWWWCGVVVNVSQHCFIFCTHPSQSSNPFLHTVSAATAGGPRQPSWASGSTAWSFLLCLQWPAPLSFCDGRDPVASFCFHILAFELKSHTDFYLPHGAQLTFVYPGFRVFWKQFLSSWWRQDSWPVESLQTQGWFSKEFCVTWTGNGPVLQKLGREAREEDDGIWKVGSAERKPAWTQNKQKETGCYKVRKDGCYVGVRSQSIS